MYSDNWDGDVYKGAPAVQPRRARAPSAARRKPRMSLVWPCAAARGANRSRRRRRAGSGFNVLNLVIVAFVLTPVLGLAFAYWSYGTLWG